MDSALSASLQPDVRLLPLPLTLVFWVPEDALSDLRQKMLSLLQGTDFRVVLLTDTDAASAAPFLNERCLWLWALGDEHPDRLPPYPFDRSEDEVPDLFIWDARRRNSEPEVEAFFEFLYGRPSNRLSFIKTDDPVTVLTALEGLARSRNAGENIPEKKYKNVFISSAEREDESFLRRSIKTGNLSQNQTESELNPVLIFRPEASDSFWDEVRLKVPFAGRVFIFFSKSDVWAGALAVYLRKNFNATCVLIGDVSEGKKGKNRYFAPPPTIPFFCTDETGFKSVVEQKFISGSSAAEVVPYTGLLPYSEADALFFSGRERPAQTLVRLLIEKKWVMVAGASGDGKSSLIYAGLIPELKAGLAGLKYPLRKTVIFKPEKSPLTNLARAVAHSLALDEDFIRIEDRLSMSVQALKRIFAEYIARHPGETILLVPDQFEEFFTRPENYIDGTPSVSARWTVSLIVEVIKAARTEELPVLVVGTMRSDYIGQCVAFPNLSFSENLFFIPPPEYAEIRDIIEKPALQVGKKVAHRLTQRLIRDIGSGNDRLPVLQHCLEQIHRTAALNGDEVYDLHHYFAQAGGETSDRHATAGIAPLKNVLNLHADRCVASAFVEYQKRYGASSELTEKRIRHIVRTTFVGLTRHDDGKTVRRRQTLKEITALSGETDSVFVGRVLNLFREKGNVFLLPALTEDPATHDLEPDTLLDIAHESLIRNWEQFKKWTDEDGQNQRIFSELITQLNRWLQHNRSGAYLLNRGLSSYFSGFFHRLNPNSEEIKRFLELRPGSDNRPEDLSPPEGWPAAVRLFLKKSAGRNLRTLRFTQAGLALIAVLFGITVYLYYNVLQHARKTETGNARILAQQSELTQQQRIINLKIAGEAEALKIKSENEKLSAERAILEEQVRQDSLLGKVRNAQKDIEIERLKTEQLEKETRLKQIERDNALRDKELALVRNQEVARLNEQIISESQQTSRQRDEALKAQSLFLANKAVEQVRFFQSEVGMLLALEALPRDPEQKMLTRPYVPQAEAALYLAVNSVIRQSPIWKVEAEHQNKITSLAYNSAGNRCASGSWDRTAKVRETKTGTLIKEIYHPHIVRSVSFSADDRFLLTVCEDFKARLFDGRFYSPVAEFGDHRDVITHAELSPDATHILTASSDGTAVIRSVYGKKTFFVLKGHRQAVTHAAFSPDGQRVVTVSADHTARLWNARTGELIAVLTGHTRPLTHAGFSPDGKTLATASKDQSVRLWNGITGQSGPILVGHGGAVQYLDFDPSGSRLASASTDGTVRVWSPAGGQTLAVLREHNQEVFHAAFSSDGSRLISSGREGSAVLWDAKNYLFLARFYDRADLNCYAVLAPDGQRLLWAGKDLSVRQYAVLPAGKELIKQARALLKNRMLTSEERKRFHINEEED